LCAKAGQLIGTVFGIADNPSKKVLPDESSSTSINYGESEGRVASLALGHAIEAEDDLAPQTSGSPFLLHRLTHPALPCKLQILEELPLLLPALPVVVSHVAATAHRVVALTTKHGDIASLVAAAAVAFTVAELEGEVAVSAKTGKEALLSDDGWGEDASGAVTTANLGLRRQFLEAGVAEDVVVGAQADLGVVPVVALQATRTQQLLLGFFQRSKLHAFPNNQLCLLPHCLYRPEGFFKMPPEVQPKKICNIKLPPR
jgi:hypothetical protein